MKQIILAILFITAFSQICSSQPNVASGKIIRVDNIESSFVKSRTIDIWIPDNYNPKKRYNVVYMQDGQMLFDSSQTWNSQEWCVDETVGKLISDKSIKSCIIVAIWNIPNQRYAEYFPQKILESIPSETRKIIIDRQIKGEPKSDDYLMFIVYELKPYIDSHFSTYKNSNHTFIMGSSMGGLISLYAMCEYPEVFAGAACLSMHSPLASYELINSQTDTEVASKLRDYLNKKLPKANSHKVYFDFGSLSGDAYYKPFQTKIDELMLAKGYKSDFWQTREFLGEDHSEKSWAKRLNVPFEFLLGR